MYKCCRGRESGNTHTDTHIHRAREKGRERVRRSEQGKRGIRVRKREGGEKKMNRNREGRRGSRTCEAAGAKCHSGVPPNVLDIRNDAKEHSF